MPELAEVEYYRKRWDAGLGRRILGVELHEAKRVFREKSSPELARSLSGRRLISSQALGKQMLFGFSGGVWLGLHLGMTGSLRSEAPGAKTGPHDHLVLRQKERRLVFSDPRQFGRLRLEVSSGPPAWWRALPPPVLSRGFSRAAMASFLARKRRAPVKAALLMQERFPGIGNWMADEILWRSKVCPKRACSGLSPGTVRTLWRELRRVSRAAMATIGRDFSDPPKTWLFPHRWRGGGICPRDGTALVREEVGGRTTCWCPVCQPG
jgi:formamidopyrimidine-DNA glycosylase